MPSILWCVQRFWRFIFCHYISRESLTRNVGASVCLSVRLSAAACPHYCTDPDVTWGSGRGCPIVVQYWMDLQSLHGLRCYACTRSMPSFQRTHVHVRYLLSPVRLSVVYLSVTRMRPTQSVEIFGNISTPFATLAIHSHRRKGLRRSTQGNPSKSGFKRKRSSQIQRFRTYRRLSESVEDRS